MNLLIENLNKTYDNGVHALKDISLEIPTGMFGLLGPNGAGKSSLMRTLATLQEADSGSIMLGTTDLQANKKEVRKLLGYLPQQFGLYPKISAEVLLDHFAVLKGISKRKERKDIVHALLHKTNLYGVRKQQLGGFSGGMKQRFGIAQALLNNPKLLIVDEPTSGLDPKERNRFYNLLSQLAEDTIVTVVGNDTSDPLYDQLELNYQQLVNARDAKGQPYNMVRLHLPKPVWYNALFEGKAGRWNYPASYGNFYIGNSCVLVPTFSDHNDAQALNILAECFLPLLSLLERGHLANPKHTALPSFAKQITDDCVLADLLLLRPLYFSLLVCERRVLVVRRRERHRIPHHQLANLLQHRAGFLTRRSAEVVDGF